MTRTSKAWKRLGVGGLAAVTVGAGLPVLLATGASAAPATTITITPSSQSAATGVCQTFTVNLRDASGAAADTQTVTIELTDPTAVASPAPATPVETSAQFCDVTADGITFTPRASTQGTGSAGNRRNIQLAPAPGQAASTAVTFGIVDSSEESVSVRAISGADATLNPNTEIASASSAAVFTAGNGSNQPSVANQTAADNTRTLTEVAQASSADGVVAGGSQVIRVILRNAAGNPIAGATPNFRFESGGANSAGTTGNPTTQQVTSCNTVSDNSGTATCTVGTANVGTDRILIFVNQSAGGTTGPDASEPQVIVTRQTFVAPVTDPTQARFINLTPDTVTTGAGRSQVFTATVTNVAGTPVQNVSVTFTEDGPGRFTGATTVTTNNRGVATVTTTSIVGEAGTQVVTATINAPAGGNQTGAAAGAGPGSNSTTAAGNNTDSSSQVFVFATPSPTGTVSPSPSATGTATASPTGTTTGSPSPSATAPCSVVPTVTVSPGSIGAGASASVTGRATPNSRIQLQAYSRPSTTYRAARDTVVSASGTFAFTVALGTNTRLYVQEVGCPNNAAQSKVITVRTVLSFFATRNATRRYTFTGQVLPRRSDQLVSLYRRTTRGDVLTSQVRTSANGSFSFGRQFTGSGRFDFFVRTGANLTNIAGVSNVRGLLVF